jgi:tRNA A37 methylthiotransferase MiaB
MLIATSENIVSRTESLQHRGKKEVVFLGTNFGNFKQQEPEMPLVGRVHN